MPTPTLFALNFNPHSREGSDENLEKQLSEIKISIHTPAKGVTYKHQPYLRYWMDFNPHSREGSDKYEDGKAIITFISIHTPAKGVTTLEPSIIALDAISIHTPAKGVTQVIGNGKISTGNFNPHSREGSDFKIGISFFWHGISIHTPAKGVTLPPVSQIVPSVISIHTPAKGVTHHIFSHTSREIISIHTPAKGVTVHGGALYIATRFQSTLPRRE